MPLATTTLKHTLEGSIWDMFGDSIRINPVCEEVAGKPGVYPVGCYSFPIDYSKASDRQMTTLVALSDSCYQDLTVINLIARLWMIMLR